MKQVVRVKGVTIGEGIPKICVPMVGKTLDELLEEAHLLKTIDLDIIEWRADFFEEVEDTSKVKMALKTIREVLIDKPIIFTFRSAKEGGQREATLGSYFELNKEIIKTKLIDIVDIELFNDDVEIKTFIDEAHKNNVAVIISNHDFHKTPSKEEIISRLLRGFELGGDIAKIAVMPNSAEDVITLLDATRIMKEEYGDRPIITVSMGGKGLISRLAVELFGSDLTFAAVKNTSAPGQISVEELSRVMGLIHRSLQ